jgi:transcriptional regulator with XRE-family HTH domain
VRELARKIGARLKELRLARQLTQEQLAERAGVSHKFLGEIERGAGNPTIEWLEDVAAALDTHVHDLVSDEGPREAVYRPLSASDYSVVREARNSLEEVLKRFDEKRGEFLEPVEPEKPPET